jgi:hypothetical protein
VSGILLQLSPSSPPCPALALARAPAQAGGERAAVRVDRASTTATGKLIKIGRRDIEKTGPSARTHGHGVAPPLTWPTFEEQAAS